MYEPSERYFMNTLMKHTFIALALIVPITALSAFADEPTVEPTTVETIDLTQYVGTWHEVARLPMPYQSECVSDVTATYTLQDKVTTNGSPKVAVLNECRKQDGSLMQASGMAVTANETGTKLKVTFMPKWLRWLPVGRADYWVLAVDDDYQTAMVGTPDNDYLWLLSRTPVMDSAVYGDYTNLAANQGYDIARLKISDPQLLALSQSN